MIKGIDFPSKQVKINDDKYFIPASNTKLFTSYLALETLGNDYLFSSGYTVKKNMLMLKILGNPLITENDIISMISKIDEEISDIIIDCKFLNPTSRPPGWCVDDIDESYAPPVSEINYEMNRIAVTENKMVPENTYYKIKNYTGSSAIRGKIIYLKYGEKNYTFSTNAPIKFYINSLIMHMMKKGISRKTPKIRFLRVKDPESHFAEHHISELIRMVNKESENILAEMLLLYTGMYKGYVGLDKSLTYLHNFFRAKNITELSLYDGSGLSYYNLVSPRSIVRLLELANENLAFKNSLSIGMVDGTLKNRLSPRVIGKTGSLRNVQNLSGYFDGNPFSIMINNEPDEKLARESIDSFLNSYF
jgi:D-alanyl-D-alanine carboxypeptidase/D-alanyl-D-alanine-endopeptidase (penicillin-binding protein 4)